MSKIEDTVTPSVLYDFKKASRALWRDLRFRDGDFRKNDIHDYMRSMMSSALTEAEVEGPIEIENNPMICAAIEYVRHNDFFKKPGVAERFAEYLYNLDAEAVRVMKRELDKAY